MNKHTVRLFKEKQKKKKSLFFSIVYKVTRIDEIVYWCKATINKEFIRNSNTRELRQIKCNDPCWKKADTVHTKIMNCQQLQLLLAKSLNKLNKYENKIRQTLKEVILRHAFKSTSKWGVWTTPDIIVM